jgi:hypothetical protein
VKRFRSPRKTRFAGTGRPAERANLHIPFARLTQVGLVACTLFGATATRSLAQDAAKPVASATQTSAAPAQTPAAPTQTPAAPAAPGQAPAAPAAPAAPPPPAPGSVSYSGLIDIYYGFNARAPHPPSTILTPSGEKIHVDNTGRAFDINDRDPSLSLAEFNITRVAGKGFPLGITATLTAGDTARLVHANEPGGTSSWQTFQQFYLTYTPHILGRDVAIDFGKWVTPFGYEVIESSSNDNYSRSFGFTYGIPLYHAGLRATIPLNSKLSVLGGIVNGWNNVADDNDAKSGMIQFTWKPDAFFTGILGYMGGQEGTGAYGTVLAPVNKAYIDTNLYEFQPILVPGPNWKFAGDIILGDGAGSVGTTHVSGNWLGMAAYARFQINARIATALRVEQFEDAAGAGGIGLRTGGTGYTKLDSFTLTFEYAALKSKLITRLEFRHDWANSMFYAAGSGTAKDQDTTYLSAVYKF